MSILYRTARRLYGRAMLGMLIPGQYYFLTWTSPNAYADCWDLDWRADRSLYKLLQDWDALRKWLHRERPRCSWCYCFTNEGYGVIHMIIRLGKGERRFRVDRVRKHWVRLHGANQIKIKAVKKGSESSLAAYFESQKRLVGLGREMAWQKNIIRWRWSKGWIPRGYISKFKKLWVEWADAPAGTRWKVINDSIQMAHFGSENLTSIHVGV